MTSCETNLPRQCRDELAEAGSGLCGGRSVFARKWRSRGTQCVSEVHGSGTNHRTRPCVDSPADRRRRCQADHFALNGTDALNLAIHGLLRPGDHAICTAADHNSVLRPLRYLEEHGQIEVTRVKCDNTGRVDPDDIRRALRPDTRLVAMMHASNVTGTVEPVAEVGRIVREHGARFLIDAAQTAGHLPLNVDQLHADLLAAPGHKGLLGPLGTGFLYIRPGLESQLQTVRQGGTGTDSEQDRQPDSLPYKFESGTHNVPGLVGLAAALSWLESRTVEAICHHEKQLAARMRRSFRENSRRRIAWPRSKQRRRANFRRRSQFGRGGCQYFDRWL